jgi:Domain of unknown function (DUF1707)
VTGQGSHRAADTDRQAVADRLRRAHDEGRLGFAEYDDRLARAYAAVTYADLEPLVADLPAEVPPVRPAAPVRTGVAAAAKQGSGRGVPGVLVVLWTVWACGFGVNLLVWALVSLGNGRPDTFWPQWLLVPAAVLLVLTAGARALRRR